jgi:hypothetical protein
LHVMGDVTITSTGALTIPRGTTPEQPSDPVAGMIRYNDTEGYIETYEPSFEQWVPIGIFLGVLATGGDEENIIIDSIQYRVHTFTINGQFNVLRGGEVEYLIVAGGGGGGSDNAGGGGGGGVLHSYFNTASQPYSVIVGLGGNQSGTINADAQTSGGKSSVFGLEALGGGFGANGESGARLADLGGSGGGGDGERPTNGAQGTPGQGFPGGNGFRSPDHGGGGGGAGSEGQRATSQNAGDGGQGFLLDIHGSPRYYGAGGGGGGANGTRGGTGGSFTGKGIGKGSISGIGTDGETNSGGGGGGSTGSDWTGGAGGSGIVIIRYRIG